MKENSLACVPNQQFSAGFTLIETLIVMLIIGIVGMLGLPALNATLKDTQLSAAADDVVTALEYAQLTAITSGRKILVAIDDSLERITVKQYKTIANLFYGGDMLMASDVESGAYQFMKLPLNKGVDYLIDLNADITASSFIESNPVYFNTLGTPSKGGTVTVTLQNRQVHVCLNAVTGKVTVIK